MSSIAGHPRWPGTVRHPLKHPNIALAGDPALAPGAQAEVYSCTGQRAAPR